MTKAQLVSRNYYEMNILKLTEILVISLTI